MKKALAIFMIGILLLTTVSLLATSVSAKEDEPVIIGFKDKPNEKLVKRYGGEITCTNTISKTIAARLPSNAISVLARNKHIAYIEKDLKVYAIGEILPWGVDKIDADVVHSHCKGTGVKVAIIDTGIDYYHPDLYGNYKGGYDFVNDDSYPLDDHGHGTHVAGIIAAEDNDIGVIGVAPEAYLYGVKVLNNKGSGYLSDIIAGIEWSVTNEMDIITMSLGSNYHYSSLQFACDAAYEAGIIIVAAAGNDGNFDGTGDSVDYPAKYSSVIAVAATDSNYKRAIWSSTGSAVELAAPGVSIYSTYRSNSYASMSGTSMACPHVTGTAALVLASDSTLTNAQVRQRLQNTADDLGTTGKDNLYGYGFVDADEAAPCEQNDELPSITITNPTDGATVSGIITIEATANDDNGVSTVDFYIGEDKVGTDSTAPYEYTWDTTTESEGSHSIKAIATDTEGQTADDSNTITVDNSEPENTNSMHVESIDMKFTKAGKKYTVFTTVKIVDDGENAVQGATVNVLMTFGKRSKVNFCGTTDTDGTVTFQYGPTKKKGTYTSTVTDVMNAGWTYDKSANWETSENLKVK